MTILTNLPDFNLQMTTAYLLKWFPTTKLFTFWAETTLTALTTMKMESLCVWRASARIRRYED